MEEAGTDSQEDRRSGKSVGGGGAKKYNRPAIAKPSNHAVESSEKPKGPGKTTFAERVKLFQNLGKKPPEAAAEVASSAPEPVVPAAVPVGQRKIAFAEHELANHSRHSRKFKEGVDVHTKL